MMQGKIPLYSLLYIILIILHLTCDSRSVMEAPKCFAKNIRNDYKSFVSLIATMAIYINEHTTLPFIRN